LKLNFIKSFNISSSDFENTILMSKILLVGKSHFICELIKYREQLFTSKFCRIIYCQPSSLSGQKSEVFEKLKQFCPTIELCHGIPNISKLHLDIDNLPALIILDDMMQAILNSSSMVDLFTVQVHHNNIRHSKNNNITLITFKT
jgi:hypothetical protein